MPFNGSGTFNAPVVTGWPAVSGAVISSTAMNAVINDILSGLSAVLVRDGQAPMTGPLDMGGNSITNTTFVREAKASDLPSATTTDIGGAAGRFVDVTGTTTITGFGTSAAGTWKLVRFTGALTLTHNATKLILPGGANITTATGDALLAVSLGAGNWVVLLYQRAAALAPSYTPVNKAGDTMTGALTLSGDPSSNLHAATKQYADTKFAKTGGSVSGSVSVTGDITATGNITAYSDARLKSEVETIKNALNLVRALRGVRYMKDGRAGVGVIAQEVQHTVPEVVQQGEEYLSVAYGNLVGVLIEAVKELADKVERLTR